MPYHMNRVVEQLEPSQIRVFANLAAQTPGCISLTLGEPDFATPLPIVDAAIKALAQGETHYIKNAGSDELRCAIADFEYEHNGLKIDANQVIVTAGATEALYVSIMSVVNPGDEVLILTPAFGLYEQICKLVQATVRFVDISQTNYQIDEAVLRKSVSTKTAAIIVNTPNNPTGCVLNRASLDVLARAAQESGAYVICDDVYRQLYYGNQKPGSLMDYPELAHQAILVQSFSKPYAMTGWRMGYLVAPMTLAKQMQLAHQYLITSTPAPFQAAGIAALTCDVLPMIKTYAHRRALVLERLHAMGLEVPEPEGAFYVFPHIDVLGMTSTDFARSAITEAKVAVVPGACFGQDHAIRISYCCGEDQLMEGLSRLEQFVAMKRGT